jgi:ABC-type phosphate transport system substrate-binding protein
MVRASIMTFAAPGGLVAFALTLCLAGSVAMADVVPIVSSTSAITTLSKTQVTDIFLGKVSRFPDGTQAIPIDQAEGSPARDEFYATYAGKSPAQIKSHWAKIIFTGRGQPPKTVVSDSDVKILVAANPPAISYIERSAVDTSVHVLLQP